MELMIYVVITVIVGALLLFAIRSFDHEKQYREYSKTFRHDEGAEFDSMLIELPEDIAKAWEECKFGLDNMSTSVYIKDNGSVTREQLLADFLRIDKCDVIDCKNKTGGLIVHEPIKTPKIINIRCINNSLIIT